MASNPDRHRLTEAEHQRIFERDIVPAVFSGAKSTDRPVAVIFGGQPGAGKSAAVDATVRELGERGGAVQVIGDELRSYHPRYAELMAQDDKTAAFYTDRDSGRWVEKAIQHAKDLRVNLVIEGTMRDGTKVAETMTSLRQAGYEIDARALAVNERLSWQGVMQRYEEQRNDRGSGRMTAPHSHRDAYEGKRGLKALLTSERRRSYSRSLSPSLTSSMNKSFDQARPMALSSRFSNALKLSPSRRTSMARQLLPSAAVATQS
jgi:predicted ABC-type ATPase